jgi:hypothetical protein
MKRLARFSFSLAAAAALTAAAASADAPKPIRHLMYSFDISIHSTSTVHDSGLSGGPISGSTDYQGGTSDKGQIVVDVLQVQPDNGLVVQISEQARDRRDAEPTMCVVYGTSAFICDQSKGELHEEEGALLRFLGRSFVNPALIDAHNHWQYSASNPNSQETTDFTLGKAAGDVVPISYQSVLKVSGAQSFDATTDGSLSYNQKMSVPVTVKEETTTRRNTGMGNYDTVQQQLTLSLTADSLAQSH